MKPIAGKLQEATTGVKNVYVYFNNHARRKAPANALMFRSLLGKGPAMALPEALVRAYPRLKALLPSA